MGGTGCYLYLHYLTKEVVSLRPDDYIDEVSATSITDTPVAVRDPANGIRRIDLSDLQQEVDKIVREGKKTPLLIDNSKSGGVRAFYTYKGQLEVGNIGILGFMLIILLSALTSTCQHVPLSIPISPQTVLSFTNPTPTGRVTIDGAVRQERREERGRHGAVSRLAGLCYEDWRLLRLVHGRRAHRACRLQEQAV